MSVKYSCDCCGYRSLLDNEIGEICPICYWTVEYFDPSEVFGTSSANYITLYEAQENYVKYGAYKYKYSKFCRSPLTDEIKDENWHCIQDKFDATYKTFAEIAEKIYDYADKLKINNALTEFQNFGSLFDIDTVSDNNDTDPHWIKFEGEYDWNKFYNQLHVKALTITLAKINYHALVNLLNEYYRKGIIYYPIWLIIIETLVTFNNNYLNKTITDIFLDVELKNYFGLIRLRKILTTFWEKFKI